MTTRQATEPRPRYFAMELAEHFLAEMRRDADADERERVQTTILCAGQHLADRGAPGVWDELEPAAFLAEMPVESEHAQLGICLDLVGLYGWLGMNELIDPVVAAEMLIRLRAAGPDAAMLRDLCDSGVEMLCLIGRHADGEADEDPPREGN